MEWRPAGWCVYLRLPVLIFPCTIKSRSSLLAPAHPGGPGKMAVKWLWCGVVVVRHCTTSYHLQSLTTSLLLLMIFRPHHSSTYVDVDYCYRSSAVYLSICHDRELCKNNWTDRHALSIVDSESDKPKESRIRWGPRSPWEGNKGRPIVKYWEYHPHVPRSRQIIMPEPHHSIFFYKPYALPDAQTVSKHWRQLWLMKTKFINDLNLNSASILCNGITKTCFVRKT